VDLRVDGEGRVVDRVVALDHLAGAVDQHQVGHAHLAEVHAQRAHPEVVGQLRVAGGDVAVDAVVEPEAGEHPVGGGEPLLAVPPLLLGRGECGWLVEGADRGHGAPSFADGGAHQTLPHT
jgi:hypothetical protein